MSHQTHAKTGFGIADRRRAAARRRAREIARVENRPAPTAEQLALADLFVYARAFKHPLAA